MSAKLELAFHGQDDSVDSAGQAYLKYKERHDDKFVGGRRAVDSSKPHVTLRSLEHSCKQRTNCRCWNLPWIRSGSCRKLTSKWKTNAPKRARFRLSRGKSAPAW